MSDVNPIVGIWGTLREPRSLTALVASSYLICVMVAIGLLVRSPVLQGWQHDVLRYVSIVFLLPAGVVGLPSAWRGLWWIERGAAIGAAFGWGIAAAEALLVEVTPGETLAMPVATLGATIVATLLYGMRYLRCRSAPYAPGTGPELPEVRAEKMLRNIND